MSPVLPQPLSITPPVLLRIYRLPSASRNTARSAAPVTIKGGFYSYSWLENFVGCRLRNAASALSSVWFRPRVCEQTSLNILQVWSYSEISVIYCSLP
jgi:hypothetical protein